MNPRQRAFILRVLKAHNAMTIATVRPDGWPQATTVTFANNGLDLYFGCERASQKVRNISRNPRVSVTVDHYCDDWQEIRGISLGGSARVVTDLREFQQALRVLRKKFPQYGEMGDEDLEGLAIVRVTPKVVSILDYGKGFGHTELVKA
jgi:PPOX class probable F420-dependent enzyme